MQNKNGQSIKFSIRISGYVTSISLKKNLAALWIVLQDFENLSKQKCHRYILDFIYSCLNNWKKDHAKGFSDFVSYRMIKDILSKNDFILYKDIYKNL